MPRCRSRESRREQQEIVRFPTQKRNREGRKVFFLSSPLSFSFETLLLLLALIWKGGKKVHKLTQQQRSEKKTSKKKICLRDRKVLLLPPSVAEKANKKEDRLAAAGERKKVREKGCKCVCGKLSCVSLGANCHKKSRNSFKFFFWL